MGKLLAGTAVRDITPSAEVLELLKSEGRYAYTGVAHPLFLKTLILTDGEKKFAYFSTDLSRFTVNDEVKKRFSDELNLEDGEYIFSTIRTHNTISGFGVNLHDETKKGSSLYGQFFFQMVIESYLEAMENVVPARIGAAEGSSYISVKREQFTPAGNFESSNTGMSPAPWLRVARVESMEGKTLALIVNYSMQNCMVCWYSSEEKDYNMITNDTAGEITDYLEKIGKHEYPVMWSNGGGADRQPAMYLADYCDVNDAGEFSIKHQVLPIKASLMIMKILAADQSRDVMNTVKKIQHYSDEFVMNSQVVYKNIPGKEKVYPRVNIYHAGDDVRPVTSVPVELRLQMTVINDIVFCSSNGPVYADVYKKLREMMPFEVTFLFDDCLGGERATVIPSPDMEETGRYVHATLQSMCYTARIGFNVFMHGFGKMLERYMLKNVVTYEGAVYPDFEEPGKWIIKE